MKTTDFLNLDTSATKKISAELQNLLADFQLYYSNLRNFHWYFVFKQFFRLHDQFEELYDEAATQIDEIAERILMLGETPNHNFSDYLKVGEIKETGVVSDAKETVSLVLDYLKVLVAKERKIVEMASEAGDEVTVGLMVGYLEGQEKTIWMLTAFLS